jgi:pimeloyl-ACP methyl ester carboxylesterase
MRIERDDKGSFDMSSDVPDVSPSHLLIMINGIGGSALNWRYAAKQFLKNFPNDVIVYCSERNSAKSTLDGVDVMGQRLAEEVTDCIRRHPSVQKISFVGHSLGGLVARYAIARLFLQRCFR